ncbi:MAG: hypothetical protein JWO19_931 [Bryobacterales bacterium]|nr:hypothetical protein [Bryobacterales bacterium]
MTRTPDSIPIDANRPSVCLNLAGVRQAKGLGLEEIVRSTKIDLRFLQAIEAEDFAELPRGLYSTSFIRQYAQAIGYDESLVLERYHGQMDPEPTVAPSRQGFAWLYWRRLQALRSFLHHLTPRSRSHHTT